MRRVVLSELWHRRSRTLALLVGILIATAAFTVLTATSRTQRLQARGTVAESFRGQYDVLVRPRGSRSAFERETAQVQPNFLSGLFGGISIAQWRRIERLPGVEVAAPIANLGYLLPTAKLKIDVSDAAGSRGRVLLRARIAWTSDRGLTHVEDAPQYAYVTSNRLRGKPYTDEHGCGDDGLYRCFALREDVPGRRRPVPVCNELWSGAPAGGTIRGPFAELLRSSFGCFSRQGKGEWGGYFLRRMTPHVLLRWAFPMLLTAIDPVAEARLTGLDRAVVRGRYLSRRDRAHVDRISTFGYEYDQRFLPVLAAGRTFVDERAEIAVERLGAAAVARWTQPFPMSEADYLHAAALPHSPAARARGRARPRARRRRIPPPAAVVVDTSALAAVLFGEPERDSFVALLADAEDPLISAATLVEASIVMQARTGPDGVADLDDLLAAAAVRCVAVDRTQAHIAREAFARFGKGRATAGLNLGDCFSYALAKAKRRPLLFKGTDFSETDVAAASPP